MLAPSVVSQANTLVSGKELLTPERARRGIVRRPSIRQKRKDSTCVWYDGIVIIVLIQDLSRHASSV